MSSLQTTAMSTQTQRRAAVRRTGSFLGTIRNIVTAPLQWFASTDDLQDTRGKRRKLPAMSEESGAEDDSSESKPKRMRVCSPERPSTPYLDPPSAAFKQPRRTTEQVVSRHQRHISSSPRKILRVPTDSATLHRRTLSPYPSRSQVVSEDFTRTMSLDPPSHSRSMRRLQSAVSMQDVQEELGDARDSMPIEPDMSMSMSMSPRRRPRPRQSLTPQPSDLSFGPVVPVHRVNDSKRPPPLATLRSNPTFVKPPPDQQNPDPDAAQQLTLGALVDSQRNACSPVRENSVLFGTGSVTDVSARHLWPTNVAEKAFHELEVYKTPLLPTRLRGSGTIPNMFLSKKSHSITPMTDARDDKPRLGMKGKGKHKDKAKKKDRGTNHSKPYKGEGGMKKWLAKRKVEVQQGDKEMGAVETAQDDGVHAIQEKQVVGVEEKQQTTVLQNGLPSSDTIFKPGAVRSHEGTSFLRVGRTKITRNHIQRPTSVLRKKFSAVYENEDDEMDDTSKSDQKVEDITQKVPAAEILPGFSFADRPVIMHDTTDAREPPIGALPFSLTNTAAAPLSAPTAAAPLLAPKPEPQLTPAPVVTVVPPAIPTSNPVNSTTAQGISATHSEPPPEVAAIPVSTPPAPPSLPDTSVAPQPQSLPMTKPLFGEHRAAKPEELKVAELPVSAPSAPPAITSSVFDTPSTASSGPLFGASASSAEAPPFATPVTSSSPFGTSVPTTAQSSAAVPPPFIFSKPKLAESLSPFPSEPPKTVVKEMEPISDKAATPFSFGAGRTTPSAPTTEVAKPPFSFGQPPVEPAKSEPTKLEAPKPPFEVQPLSSPFTFDQSAETKKTEEKPSSLFSFGSTPAQPAIETKPPSVFSFGTPAPATTPAYTFGAPSSERKAADVSGPAFSFTPSAPARSATPPKVEEEVTMDESPAREMNLNGEGKAPERPTLSFAFGAPSTSGSALFAQSPLTPAAPFSFGQSTATPFTSDAKPADDKQKAPFAFGQPSTGFSFNHKVPEIPTITPSVPFTFGQPSPAVAPTSPFTFAAPSAPFGQTSASSAPPSPSTFNRPTSTPAFTFGSSSNAQSGGSTFAFGTGSQPASPARAATALPSTGPTFTFSASTTNPNPFGSSTSSSAPGFIIGSAPPPPEGGRQIKKLPRRGGRR